MNIRFNIVMRERFGDIGLCVIDGDLHSLHDNIVYVYRPGNILAYTYNVDSGKIKHIRDEYKKNNYFNNVTTLRVDGMGGNYSTRAYSTKPTLQLDTNEYQQYILDEFKVKYPELGRVHTYDGIKKLVEINKDMRIWYTELRNSVVLYEQTPEWVRENSKFYEIWKGDKDAMIKFKTDNSNLVIRENKIVEQYKKEIYEIRTEREKLLKQLPMILRILRISKASLPLSDLQELVDINDVIKYNIEVTKKLDEYKAKLLDLHLKGVDIEHQLK